MSNMLPPCVAEALEKADRKQIQLAGVGCFAHVIKKNVSMNDLAIILLSCDTTASIAREMVSQTGLCFNINLLVPWRTILRSQTIQRGELNGPLQAAEALRFIHSRNVIHSDFGSHNFLIQEDGTLALADFGGSRIDNTSAVVSYSTRYARPCSDSDDLDSTEIDDLFALGTIIYEISVGHQLYADRSSREIRKLLHQQEFPDLESIAADIREVIRKCWSNGYQTAEEVIYDLKATSSPSCLRLGGHCTASAQYPSPPFSFTQEACL